MEVNGTVVDVNMKIDETGSGYFVRPRTPSEVPCLNCYCLHGNGAKTLFAMVMACKTLVSMTIAGCFHSKLYTAGIHLGAWC